MHFLNIKFNIQNSSTRGAKSCYNRVTKRHALTIYLSIYTTIRIKGKRKDGDEGILVSRTRYSLLDYNNKNTLFKGIITEGIVVIPVLQI